jgi:hypothetical protein
LNILNKVSLNHREHPETRKIRAKNHAMFSNLYLHFGPAGIDHPKSTLQLTKIKDRDF